MTANRSKFTGDEINPVEKMIEDGLVFEASSKIAIINNGGIGKWLVRTGSKRVKVLARYITSNGNEMDYQVKGGVTVSAAGTPVLVANRNKADAQKAPLRYITPQQLQVAS
jgi:hypothetical protein